MQVETKIRLFKNLIQEKSLIENEHMLDVLAKSKSRSKMMQDALRPVLDLKFKSNILEVKKETEIQKLINIIQPKKRFSVRKFGNNDTDREDP